MSVVPPVITAASSQEFLACRVKKVRGFTFAFKTPESISTKSGIQITPIALYNSISHSGISRHFLTIHTFISIGLPYSITHYGSIDLDRTSKTSKSRLFPVRDTHQRTLRHRFSGACQLRCKQITQFRIVKCHRLFRPKISKVKPSFVAEIRQVSNTLTPNAGVFGDTLV